MPTVKSPYPQFFDTDGGPLNAGYIYIGTAGQNPETNAITVYWDAALTQPAAQPLRTLNGYIYRAGTPAEVHVDADDYSITVRNSRSALVVNSLNANALVYMADTIHAATTKATPVNADEWGFWDSVSGALRKLTSAQLITWLSGLCSAGWNSLTSSSCTGNSLTSSSCTGNAATATTATNAGTSGTFTITGTGFTANPTATATWYLNNGVVSLRVPASALTGTSNATTFTLTGLPAAIVPISGQVSQMIRATDNSANINAIGTIAGGANVMTLSNATGAGWTASGTKTLVSTLIQWTRD